MKVKTLFLQKHAYEATKELDCYGYCLDNAIAHFLNSDFEKAAVYHENIARSLNALQRMKKDKIATDQAAELLKRIEARDQEELMRHCQ